MGRLVMCIHMSLDGFVAGPHGEIDWISLDEGLFDYVGGITKEADTAMYGRLTFEMMDAYWPTAGDLPNATRHDREHSRWYNSVTKVVLSKTMSTPSSDNILVLGDDIPRGINRIKSSTVRNILMFGSPTAARTLMHYDLIDDYRIFISPIILGAGVRLFEGGESRIALRLLTTSVFQSGVAELHYARHNH